MTQPTTAPQARVTVKIVRAVNTTHEVWLSDGLAMPYATLLAVGSSLGDARVKAVAALEQLVADVWTAEP